MLVCECVCSWCDVGVGVSVCVPGLYTPIYSEHTIMDCMQLMDGWCVYVGV